MIVNTNYGSFLQDGGIPQQQGPVSVEEQLAAQEAAGQQAAPQGGEIEQVVQQFLEAFQQLPPEAQQMIVQALTGGA